MSKLEIEIGAVTDGLSEGLKDAESKLQRFSQTAVAVGKTLSLAVTAPLTGLAALGVRNFDRQAQAIGQIETALISTGNAAGRTSQELQDFAQGLQAITTFGDEEILQKVTAQLLTFTNIANTQFDRTQKAALDLATRLGGDLQGATIQLGKALNDPIANLSALSRSGIQFSEDQKTLIKSLVETNQLAEAQNIILDELEKQYGGSAEAAAKLGTGPLRQLSNQFGDLLEDVGEVILKAINPLIGRLQNLISVLQGLSPQTKTFIVAVGAVVASIGPLLVVLGSLGAALPIIASGFAAVKVAVIAATGPFGLIAAAIGAAIFLLIDLNRELKRTAEIAGEVRSSNLDETTKNIKNEVDELAKSYQRINTDLTENEAKQKALNTVLEAYETRLKSIQETDPGNLNRISFLREQIGAIKNLQNEFNGLTVEVTNTGSAVKQTLEQFSKLADIANEKVFAKFAEDAKIFNDELRETISLQRRLEQFSGEALESIQDPFKDISNSIIADIVRIGEPVKEIADEFDTTFQRIGRGVDELSGAFIGLGSIIGKAFNNTGLGAFVGQFAQLASRLIASNFKIATSASIASASQSAIATGPAAIFTLPAFIASAVGLIATAFAGIGGGSGRGVSAGSGVGSGVAQNISGGGAQGFGFDRNIQLFGRVEVEGDKLVYAISNSNNYRN